MDYIGSGLWIAVFAILIGVIIIGNLLVVLALTLSKQLSAVISYQFVNSLAITDLLVGVYLPYHMAFYLYKSLNNSEVACIFRFIVPTFICTQSILKLLTIAADRYVGIFYPLHYNKYMTGRTVWVIIIGGWTLAIFVSTIPVYWNNWVETTTCDTENFLPSLYFNFILTPMFAAAWLVMLIVYLKIWKEARRHAKIIGQSYKNRSRDAKSLQVVMLTLGSFTICWMPYFIVTTYYRITGSSNEFSLVYEVAFTMAVGNSGINPIIYAWKNSNFREAFWCLLTCRSPNTVLNKSNYITNHVPSKKGSMVAAPSSAKERNGGDVEMGVQRGPGKDYDERECSVSTEVTTD